MITYAIIGILIAFLVGYITGKRQGLAAGYRDAEATLPLKIRQQSLEQGKCIICEDFLIRTTKSENFSREMDTL